MKIILMLLHTYKDRSNIILGTENDAEPIENVDFVDKKNSQQDSQRFYFQICDCDSSQSH